ncbi:MAG: ABC transporter ATP-binding protein [Spirochaetales bacterium]|nr:ABC transporter ATP-binding protein [Spirochaetales bacterium]
MEKYIKAVLGLIILQIIFSALSNLSLAFMPYFVKLMFDTAPSGDVAAIIRLCVGYSGCILGSLVFTYIDQYFSWKMAIVFEGSVKRDFFAAVSAYSYSRFRKTDVGEYIAMQGNEIQELEMDYLTPIVEIFKSTMSFTVYAIVLFIFIDWRIGAVIVPVSVITALIAPKVLTKPVSRRRKIFLDKKGGYISLMKDLLEGFKLITSATRDAFLAAHERELSETLKKRFWYGKLKVLMYIFNGCFLYSLNILSFILVGVMMYLKEISIGAGVGTLGYIESFIDPVRDITIYVSSIRSTTDIKKKVMDFLTPEKTPVLPVASHLNEAIELRGASASFDDFSLGPVSLRFEKGKKYALIGHNGSGKSTILNLIMKYVEAASGEILLDGVPITNIDTSKVVWNVDQHDHMFASAFNECVTVFSALPHRNLDGLEKSAGTRKMKTISESENCQDLSGGEKQLVSIARAMLADTDVVLLDESFAAMDPSTHDRVHELVLKDPEKTVISVTHKLNEHLELYDEVILMKDGKVATRGPWSAMKSSECFKGSGVS